MWRLKTHKITLEFITKADEYAVDGSDDEVLKELVQ